MEFYVIICLGIMGLVCLVTGILEFLAQASVNSNEICPKCKRKSCDLDWCGMCNGVDKVKK